ncbi:phosphoribosyltransferase [Streptomyces sp. HNM0575]|uniref:phosphoribosyltransferase n=1 Tax=Streptomyces sp. HNM0575 TaxID=2716338 RepID=UPI00145CBD39|nr:phosphoribosyltransferase [Streptomyces sp. HNM0575]NLU71674.1 phosphoribosyltransferase [Streptomyces sp. HNM0575]
MSEPVRGVGDGTGRAGAGAGGGDVCAGDGDGQGDGGVWSGEWVAERLDVGLSGEGLRELIGLALRRNPKRAHLLVSRVLGKHVPERPGTVYGVGLRLGRRVRTLLGDALADAAVVLGYAETATGLGHSVADGIGGVTCLHSTRRAVPGVATAGGFEEEHSHATSHLLLPEDPGLLEGEGPLVLVDDEFSTGRTVRNTIAALHRRRPRERYVVVALTDMRSADDAAALEKFAAELGARVDVVALARGRVSLPHDVLERGQRLVAEAEAEAGAAVARDSAEVSAGAPVARAGLGAQAGSAPGAGPHDRPDDRPDDGPAPVPETAAGLPRTACPQPVRVELGWPPHLPDGGRHGFTAEHRARLDAALPGMAARLADALHADGALPTDGTLHADGALPTDGTLHADGALPTDGTLHADGPLPTDGTLHADGPLPTDGTLHADGALPPEGTIHADGATGHGGRGVDRAPRVLVLGCEELMYVPLRLAVALEERLGARADVRFSTTTRSPVLALDDPAYAVRTCLTFPAHDGTDAAGAAGPADPARLPEPARPAEPAASRYAYNVAPGGDPRRRFDAVVVVTDSAADTPALHAPGGLLDRLRDHTGGVLLAVVPSHRPLPPPLRGPAFSSYAPDEVGWLLQDLSDARLEAPTEEREEAIQRGGAHYAESLPVEYQPSAEYERLFHGALEASAGRVARAVGAVTETVLAERAGRGTGRPVLVSLARAGTPVGVLMRRWARHRHGLDLPHYAVSIVRGRGIDANALRWIAARHDPADVVFVDGWTGKGAITRELADALAQSGEPERHGRPGEFAEFDPEIAVLADPGGCVRTYGTREDFLIPSACLNSTVSGLISRTVLRADLVGPYDYHGAKCYRGLTGADVSGLFLDTVTSRFGEAASGADEDAAALLADDARAPTWAGWRAVERISEEYGIGDVNLVKPGVGETTRVLLRRVPWRVLTRRGAGRDLDHVRLLAEQRGVPVEETDELPYSCVGLIHPGYTRGATGADGRAAG